MGLKGEIIYVLHTSIWNLRNSVGPEMLDCVWLKKIKRKHFAYISKIWRCLTLGTAYDFTVFFFCTPTYLIFVHSFEGKTDSCISQIELSLWQNYLTSVVHLTLGLCYFLSNSFSFYCWLSRNFILDCWLNSNFNLPDFWGLQRIWWRLGYVCLYDRGNRFQEFS